MRILFTFALLVSMMSSAFAEECRDGTYSNAEHRQGSCSHHGGDAR